MSTLDGCRIGGTGGFIGNCPGPCPNYNLAADADPSNPTVIFQRGGYHKVVWSRNNHEGGFVRWTLVPLNKKDSKDWHSKMAFHYNCWNVGRFNCNDFDFHRDCNYDRQNEAYAKMLYIPPVFPDGDYVLGWTWYGGGVGFGHFGDYYDCAYVRVSGGEQVRDSYVPEFSAGGGSEYEDGCEATVDDLGICWKEPCLPMRKTEKRVPAPFKGGKTPEPILSAWYGEGTSANPPSVSLSRILLVDAKQDRILDVDLNEIILLHGSDEISLMAETNGDVEYVEWYTNGKVNGKDYSIPYTVAGDDHSDDIYPWMHPLFNRRMRVSVKIAGKDGSFSWGSVELRFKEGGPGAAHFPGQSIHDYLVAHNVHEEEDEHESKEDPEWIQEPISDADTTGATEEIESTVIEENDAPQPAPDTTTSSTEAHDSSGSTVNTVPAAPATAPAQPPQPVAAEEPEESGSTGLLGGSSASTSSGSVSAGGSSSFTGSFLGRGSDAGSKRGRATARNAAFGFTYESGDEMQNAYGQFA
ncbi:lysophospholipase [Gracilaria domingensis]|nr:lysophospholipase [Gracilaria domingensis]